MSKLKMTVMALILVALTVSMTLMLSGNLRTVNAAGSTVNNLNVRVYYLLTEYEPGRHQIIKVWSSQHGTAPPEDNTDTAINEPHGVLQFDIKYNRAVAEAIQKWEIRLPNGQVIRKYYVDSYGRLCDQSGAVVLLSPNPNVTAYDLSLLKGMTQGQLESYIDSNVTNIATARAYLKRLSAVVLYLVKQSELEQ